MPKNPNSRDNKKKWIEDRKSSGDKLLCETCGVNLEEFVLVKEHFAKWAADHKDGNVRNNDDSNFALLCRSCHNRKHSKGRPQTAHQKEAVRKFNVEFWSKEENIEKFRALKLGAKMSEESKAKMSEKKKQAWAEGKYANRGK